MITYTPKTNFTQKNEGKFILTISSFAQTLATFALYFFIYLNNI